MKFLNLATLILIIPISMIILTLGYFHEIEPYH